MWNGDCVLQVKVAQNTSSWQIVDEKNIVTWLVIKGADKFTNFPTIDAFHQFVAGPPLFFIVGRRIIECAQTHSI